VRREVLAMAADSGETKSSAPRTIRGIKSEYDRLGEELGGPADIGIDGPENFAPYCREYPLHRILPVFLRFQLDEIQCRRLWPWAAFTLGHYVFERKRPTASDEPSPKEVAYLLSKIARDTRSLASGLCRLQSLANRSNDPTSRLRRGHLAWLDSFIEQAIAGRVSNQLDNDPDQMLKNYSKRMDFLKVLANVEASAKAARVDRVLLERERGQLDPALPNFRTSLWGDLEGPDWTEAEREQG
jgi:hypothetical protein